jgi:LysM repeat protein
MRPGRALIAGGLALALLAMPAQGAMVPYTVRFGDTLTWIARAHHMNVLRLAALNHLDPYGILRAGSVIRVPSGSHTARSRPSPRHAAHHHTARGDDRRRRPVRRRAHVRTRIVVVRRGQSLWSIATAAGTTPRALAALNHRAVDAVLPVGLHLRVPRRRAVHGHSDRRRGGSHAYAVALLREWALRFGIDPRLVLAVSWQESGWQPGLRSSTGAVGLMQVMPGTWSYVEDVLLRRPVAHTEAGDVHVGVAYLAHLLHDFGGNVELAVAGYYQGEAAVRLFGLLPGTRRYVADVLALRGRM